MSTNRELVQEVLAKRTPTDAVLVRLCEALVRFDHVIGMARSSVQDLEKARPGLEVSRAELIALGSELAVIDPAIAELCGRYGRLATERLAMVP
jgi:hypothetical protein